MRWTGACQAGASLRNWSKFCPNSRSTLSRQNVWFAATARICANLREVAAGARLAAEHDPVRAEQDMPAIVRRNLAGTRIEIEDALRIPSQDLGIEVHIHLDPRARHPAAGERPVQFEYLDQVAPVCLVFGNGQGTRA